MYKQTMKVYVPNQGELELYTIGYTASILEKSVETIRAWERQKVIPTPMYKNKNVRLYHPAEVFAMKTVLSGLGPRAKKVDIQKGMWATLKEVRLEIVNGTSRNENQD